jgi:transcriptional pleiotropic repressor
LQNKPIDIYTYINDIVNIYDDNKLVLEKICNKMSLELNCNVLINSSNGKIVLESIISDEFILEHKIIKEEDFLDQSLNKQLNNIIETKINIKLNEIYIFIDNDEAKNYYSIIIPVMSKERIATIVLYRTKNMFEEKEVEKAKMICCIACIILKYLKNDIDTKFKREYSIVKSAIDKLSYSELQAILYTFEELENEEGVIIANKIAKKFNLTPSIVSNALRKFESAGVIECRSLGMKGTYIKIINSKLSIELQKLNT